MGRRRLPKALAAASLLLACCATLTHGLSEQQRQQAEERLFQQLDANKDGEVTAAETAQYVGQDSGFDWLAQEGWSVAAAAQHSTEALDGTDAGGTVSKAELAAHLRALLQDHQVVDWVEHGLGLPQYAPAFKRNAVTALDFPLLLGDGGATLASDLGVSSRLHQQQILRGLKRLVLGLGQLPSPPQQLECAAVNKSAVRLSWQAPAAAGHPLYHKYLLQRQLLDAGATGGGRGARARCAAVGLPEGGGGGGDGAPDNAGSWRGTPSCPAEPWETVADPDDELSAWLDAPPAAGSYRYRLAAWSAFGRSAFAYTPAGCAVKAAQRPRLPPAHVLPPSDMQALLASLSAGGNLSAGQGGSAGSGKAWSWSAISSAVVVALTILLKASQLRVAARLAALWRLAAGTLGRRGHLAGEAGVHTEPQRAGSASHPAAAGMQRVGSSLASLASLGGEAAAAVDEQQQQQGLGPADASGSLLYSLSSSQLLSLASSQGFALDPSTDLAGAAASGLAADGALDDAAAEQLALAIKRGQHCGHPGCHRRFDRLRDVRRRLESHYCGLCQRVFCLQHTRVSPHGPRGACGLESSCLCHACFAELAPAQQAAYERVNRLPSARASNGTHGGPIQEAAASAGGAALADTSGVEKQHPPAGTGSSDGALNEQEVAAAAAAASAQARRRWRKAGGLLRALARFKAGIADRPPSNAH